MGRLLKSGGGGVVSIAGLKKKEGGGVIRGVVHPVQWDKSNIFPKIGGGVT